MDLLSRDNPIKDICALMGVSRAGYYKWKNREPSPRDTKRDRIECGFRALNKDLSSIFA